jgi:ubiquinone/menaquinone biosynthesis C-methylase UbiE
VVTTRDQYFDDIAAEYDDIARRGMPQRDELLAEVVRWLPEDAADVLELGCGTGALTALLAERYPVAHVTAADASAEMLSIASKRLGARQIDFVASKFEDLALDHRAFDVIASNMALHHIADKAPFYRSMRLALRPGGTLVLGDEVLGITPEVERRNWDDWLVYARRPGGLSEDQIAGIEEHMTTFDHYETLPRQLELLRDAGFHGVDCVWRSFLYGVFVAWA